MFVSELVFLAQISPDLLALSDRLAKVLGGAGSAAAHRTTPEHRGAAQGAAQAVRVVGHPAEVAGGGGGVAGLLLVGEGLAVGEEAAVGGPAGGPAGEAVGGGGQLVAGQLAASSWGNPVHTRWENNLIVVINVK